MSDRTQEFIECTKLFRNNSLGLSNDLNRAKGNPKSLANVPKTKTAFNEAAAEIAKGVHRTSGLLTKLTNLVRKQGLFDDPTEEVNNLIYRIKQDLLELENKCDLSQQYIDNNKNKQQNQSIAHNDKVVSHLKSDLKVAANDFKNVLELRSSKMKDQQQRKMEIGGKGSLSPFRQIESSLISNNNGSNTKLSAQQQSNNKNGSSKFASPYADFSNTKMAAYNGNSMPYAFEQQQQQQLLLPPIADNQYYDAREKAVTEVEKTIGELGQLFKRLATMISEQQEMVERIDEDVENAVSNADKAHNILLKTYEQVSSNRSLYMKLGAIFAIFILFFVLFLL
eukprot:gene10229-13761_t